MIALLNEPLLTSDLRPGSQKSDVRSQKTFGCGSPGENGSSQSINDCTLLNEPLLTSDFRLRTSKFPIHNFIHPFRFVGSSYPDIVISITFHHAILHISLKQCFTGLPFMLLGEILHFHITQVTQLLISLMPDVDGHDGPDI